MTKRTDWPSFLVHPVSTVIGISAVGRLFFFGAVQNYAQDFFPRSSCKAVLTTSYPVDPARTTTMTPSHRPANTIASDTGRTGGASMMTQSNNAAICRKKHSKRSVDSNSVGLLTALPAEMKKSLPSVSVWIIDDASAAPWRNSVSPGAPGTPRHVASFGARRSPSTNNTYRLCCRIIAKARFNDTKLFPSAGRLLVTSSVWRGSLSRNSYSRVRNLLNCSAHEVKDLLLE